MYQLCKVFSFEIIISAVNGALKDLNKAPQEWSKAAEQFTEALRCFLCRKPSASSKEASHFAETFQFAEKVFCNTCLGKALHMGVSYVYWDAFCSKYSISETPLYVACASPHCMRVEEQKNTFMNWTTQVQVLSLDM